MRTGVEHQAAVILYMYVTHVRAGTLDFTTSAGASWNSILKINFKLIFEVSRQFKFQVDNTLCDISNINKLLQ